MSALGGGCPVGAADRAGHADALMPMAKRPSTSTPTWCSRIIAPSAIMPWWLVVALPHISGHLGLLRPVAGGANRSRRSQVA